MIPEKSKEVQQKKGFDEQTKLRLKSLLDEINKSNSYRIKTRKQKVKLDTSNLNQIRNAKFCYLQAKWIRRTYRQKIMKQDSKF